MKLQYCSDLHLEFYINRQWIKEHPLIPVGDILIIAGDTFHIGDDYAKYDFLNFVADNFAETYIIPGNHEYYGNADFSMASKSFCEAIKPNVFLVNNHSIIKQGYQLVFSTMWSNIQQHVLAILRGMADFHKIKINNQKISVTDYNEAHHIAFEYIRNTTKQSEKNIVITHHLPSEQCNSPDFRGSLLNPAFCVDKTDFIAKAAIDYWIYGHSHRNLPTFDINGTQLLTNQLGYVGSNEHLDFSPNCYLQF